MSARRPAALRLPQGRARGPAALALLGLLVLPPLALAGAAGLRWSSALARETAALQAEAARLGSVRDLRGALSAEAEARRAAVAAAGFLAPGPSAEAALAALQAAIGARADAAGVEVTRLLAGVPEEREEGVRLPLGIEVEGDPRAVLAFLGAVEGGTPLLLLPRADLVAADRPDGRARLRLALDLAGLWQPGADAPEGSRP